LRVTRFLSRGLATFVLLAALAGMAGNGAAASTYNVIYTFCSQADCNDGGGAYSTPLRDPSGVLFGTTLIGGPAEKGVAYALIPSGSSWLYQVIYSFCSQALCADGASPRTGLIEDGQTNLYGTTPDNTTHGGTVFKLSFSGGVWKLTQLYVFCQVMGCPDGAQPNATLTYKGAASGAAYDGTSPLYGTTQSGGKKAGGVVFQLTPTTSGPWTQTIIADLCQTCGTPYAPGGGVVVDSSGNLFVNMGDGGDFARGAVVEYSQKNGKWKSKQLYSFCPAKKCKDGGEPRGPLVLDAKGDVIGSAYSSGHDNAGTVFELSPLRKNWKERTLYTFCTKKNCSDGCTPVGVSLDDAGNIIGATQNCGAASEVGTVFSLGAGTLSTLYQFCQAGGSCSDGSQPLSPPIADGSGNLFGTTNLGGNGQGVIYEITP
jgi:hypothetical protein